MTESIEKVTEQHTVDEMGKRDGETNVAVGLFLFALGIPVLLGTFWAMDRPHAAFVNALCGAALIFIGGAVIVYGMRQYRKATQKRP